MDGLSKILSEPIDLEHSFYIPPLLEDTNNNHNNNNDNNNNDNNNNIDVIMNIHNINDFDDLIRLSETINAHNNNHTQHQDNVENTYNNSGGGGMVSSLLGRNGQHHHPHDTKHNRDLQSIDYLSLMPMEIIRFILGYLSPQSLHSVMLLSSLYYEIYFDFEVWKPKCRIPKELIQSSQNLELSFLLEKSSSNNDQNNNNNNSKDKGLWTKEIGKEDYSNLDQQELKNILISSRNVRFFTNELEPANTDSLKAWRILYKELGSIKLKNTYDLIASSIEASTFDEESQNISNTLEPNKKFWSSKGSSDINSSEYLIYKLEQPICIVSSLQIHVYRAFFQPSSPTYSPQFIRISVGFSPHNYHYQSGLFPVKQTEEPQTFNIDPILVVGGYIRIDLIGRTQTQISDGLYYTVLRYVCVDGRPIGSLDDRQELCDSMIQFYRKSMINIRNSNDCLSYNDLDQLVDGKEQNNRQIISTLKSKLIPKMDKFRIYNNNIVRILDYLSEDRFDLAADLVIKNNLRLLKILNIFIQNPNSEAISQYYCKLFSSGLQFTREETLYLARQSFESTKTRVFTRLFLSDKLTLSEELGDYLLYSGFSLIAAEVYNRVVNPDKVVLSLYISGSQTDTINLLIQSSENQQFSLSHLIKLFKEYSLYQAYSFLAHVVANRNEIPITMDQIKSELGNIESNSFEELERELVVLIHEQQDVKYSPDQNSVIKLKSFFDYVSLQSIFN